MAKYRIMYDFCDDAGYEHSACVEDFEGSWTDLQDYIKEMRREGCYGIGAACVDDGEEPEDADAPVLNANTLHLRLPDALRDNM